MELHGVESNIAGGEDAGHARLEGEGRTRERPPLCQSGTHQVLTCDDEPLVVATTSGPSHSVRGQAPMKTNSQLDETSSVTPESLSARVSASTWPSPRADTTSLRYRTAMLCQRRPKVFTRRR